MNYNVVWSRNAENDLISILDYLLENWGKNSATKFNDKLKKQIHLITNFPIIFPSTTFISNLRKCVIVKQVSLYYLEIEENKEIKIIRLLDNRSDFNLIISELKKVN